MGRAEGETHRREAARTTRDGFCFALPILRARHHPHRHSSERWNPAFQLWAAGRFGHGCNALCLLHATRRPGPVRHSHRTGTRGRPHAAKEELDRTFRFSMPQPRAGYRHQITNHQSQPSGQPPESGGDEPEGRVGVWRGQPGARSLSRQTLGPFWLTEPERRRSRPISRVLSWTCLVGWVEPKAKPTVAKLHARRAMGFASRYPSYGL